MTQAEAVPAPSPATAASLTSPEEAGAFSRFLTVLSRLARNPAGLIGMVIVGTYLILAIFGQRIAPVAFDEQNYSAILQPPSGSNLFGTDNFGRDIFSRVVVGTRSIMVLAFLASGLGVFLGTVIGLVTGWFGGWVDEILMRLMDVFMSFPSVLLALLFLPALEPLMQSALDGMGFGESWLASQLRILSVIITIGIVFMPRVARVVRSVVLDVKTNEFVDAAKVRGESSTYIMTREILPNATGPIVVEASIRVSYAILLAATLGYLGLGLEPPSPDWGLQVAQAQTFILGEPWVLIFPALAIASLVIGVNLLADGIRTVLDVQDSGTDTAGGQG